MHRALLPGTSVIAAGLGMIIIAADIDAWTGGRRLPQDVHILLVNAACALASVALAVWFLRQAVREEVKRAVEEATADVYRLGMVSGAQRISRSHLSAVDD